MFLLEVDPGLFPILLAVLVIVLPVIILALFIFVRMIVRQSKRMNQVKVDEGYDYEEYFGGHDNIENIEIKMSRVNVTVKNLELVKLEELKAQGMGILVVGNIVKCASQDFADKVERLMNK